MFKQQTQGENVDYYNLRLDGCLFVCCLTAAAAAAAVVISDADLR